MRDIDTCPHCGQQFGYLIDGKFYPVASHSHKMADGTKRIFSPKKKDGEKR